MPSFAPPLDVLQNAYPNLKLSVPLLALQRPRPHLKPRQLEQWAMQLPMGNTALAAEQLLDRLRLLNRSRYGCKERLQLHNCLRPIVSELLNTLRQPLRQAPIPLEPKQQHIGGLLQTLLEEMANGYKLVVTELAMNAPNRETNQMLLHEAAYLAMLYLSQRLVEAYSLYTHEPAQVWADINQLYLYAETLQILNYAVDDPYPDTPLPIKATLDHAYKRIVLLALAEPYHLMQYEASDIYRIIAGFVDGCALEPFGELVTRYEFIVDLDADRGPYYISQDKPVNPRIARLIDISLVKERLNTHLQRLLRFNMQHAELEAVSLVERQQRDMLLRLADAWSASLQRKAQRFNLDAKVELTAGLNASHYYLSQGAAFTPEIDALRLEHGIDAVDDNQHTVFATAYREALQKDRQHSQQRYNLNPWWQRNISPIGIALNARHGETHLDIRVGELVIYRFNGKPHQRWQLGVLRWLKTDYTADSQTAGQVNVGIMNLANGAVPIGVKAVTGLGSGTDYFRAIMIPRQVSLHQTRSLITPALLYDVGSILVLNLKQRLTHVRLSRVRLSTSSFTQFEFEVVNRPLDFTL